MLSHLIDVPIILGSASPRRKSLFTTLQIDFEVWTANIEEIYPQTLTPIEVPAYLSQLKSRHIYPLIDPGALLVTADTIVACDNQILGKPREIDEAIEMILSMSDRTHMVHSGVTLRQGEKEYSFTDTTKVLMGPIDREEARWYCQNYDVMDKAGAYGIQDWIGMTKIISITGSYYNVMGMPIHRLYEELRSWKPV